MKQPLRLISAFLIFTLCICSNLYSQFEHLSKDVQHVCQGMDAPPCSDIHPYFPMDGDTMRALVVFCNFPSPSGDFDISGTSLLDYWPGTSAQDKPTWADSVICPSTTNLWDRSLTTLFRDASNGKFWLIGDVFSDLYVFQNQVSYYTPGNGRNMGYAIKELLEGIDNKVDYSQYDKFDPSDVDTDGNRREPDGVVDFIFIMMRFTNAHTIDGGTYSGIAALGGSSFTFAGSQSITLDGKQIMACFPGSGAISEMFSPWHLGIPAHEFIEHYTYGSGHSSGLGAFNLCAGSIASARDREKLNWNAGTQYYPTSNTQITLQDYITVGDYIKIPRAGGDTLYIEHRRGLSYFASKNYITWPWYGSEPLYPQHPDTGLLIYTKTGDRSFTTKSAHGNWDWQQCSGGYYKTNWYSNTHNFFFPDTPDRYSGESTFDLVGKYIKDLNCNNPSGPVNYRGAGGDSNTCFDVGYNDVLSPWSNPPLSVANSSDSLTIEIVERNGSGNMVVNVYFTNIKAAKPSKPQHLVVTMHHPGITDNEFNPRLDWNANLEPDLKNYKILRGIVSTPGVDPTYIVIDSTTNNYYIDDDITMYQIQGGGGICTYQQQVVCYRVVANDSTFKISTRSNRDSIAGYIDPCAPESRPHTSITYNYDLSQNFPNPFNPSTVINYSLKDEAFVTLKIYNVLGQEVAVLVNGNLNAGNHQVEFNTSNKVFASGIYYYKLEAKNGTYIVYSSIKKMVLLK